MAAASRRHILAAASSATVWDAQPGAGATEPGAAAVTVVESDETVLRVAFYNVGMQHSALDSKNGYKSLNRCEALARDIADGFRKHCLDLLCLCELGERAIGLHGRKHLSCDTQADLLEWVVRWTNKRLGGASEPAELVSGEHPTYAVIKRSDSELEVEDVQFHRRLDGRPGPPPFPRSA